MPWKMEKTGLTLQTINNMLLLLLLSLHVNGEISPKNPRILPELESLIIKSGTDISLECEANEPIQWELPNNDIVQRGHEYNILGRATIEAATPSPDYKYKSKLTVRSTTYLDTGVYYCHHQGKHDLEDKSYAAQIPVYVTDEQKLVVADSEIIGISVVQPERAIIPCIPTHPDVSITLMHDYRPVEMDGITWEYDQHRGFILKEPTVLDTGLYECLGEYQSKVHSTYVHLTIRADIPVPKPHINNSYATRVLRGKNFTLDCSISYQSGIPNTLMWKVPSANGFETGRIKEEHREGDGHRPLSGYSISHKVLTVTNASKEDEGLYECICSDLRKQSETDSINISIHDAGYIELSVVPTRLEALSGSNIVWVLEVDAYPDVTVVWYKDKNVIPTTGNPKYSFEEMGKNRIFHIKSLELRDAGEYRVEASNSRNDTRVLNLTLIVTGPPEVRVLSPKEYKLHDQNTSFTFSCEIQARPRPPLSNVTLWYRDCIPTEACRGPFLPLLPASEDKSLLVNAEEMRAAYEPRRSDLITVSAKGVARQGREYLCKACNARGCNNHTMETVIPIHVTDIPGLADVLVDLSETPPARGDPVTLGCYSSLYVFSPGFEWTWINKTGSYKFHKGGTNLPKSFSIETTTTNYTYTEKLVWTSIPQTANGTYVCTATLHEGEIQSKNLSFLVLNPVKPSILNVSPKEIEVEQGSNSTELFCDGVGVPIPQMKWLKDGEPFIGDVTTTSNGTRIKFPYIYPQQSGIYSCHFQSRLGEDVRDIKLAVRSSNPTNKAIAAAVAVTAVLVVVLVICLLVKLYKEKKRKEFFRVEQLQKFQNGDPDSINPDLGVDEQAELLPYDNRWEFPRERLKLGKQLGAGAFGRVLKAEAVGITQSESEAVTIVAVKMVKPHANATAFKALMSELKIMIHMGSHLNVVNLLGACTKNVLKGELLVIVEYCRYGNMQNYLIRHRDVFIDQVDHSTGSIDPRIGAEALEEAAKHTNSGYEVPNSPLHSPDYRGLPSTSNTDMSFVSMSPTAGGTVPSDLLEIDSSGQMTTSTSGGQETRPPWRSNYRGDYQNKNVEPICTRDLLCWAFQVARGMDYLTSRKVMHGDLAARNILLADNKIVKIADFGLAREVYRSGNYKKKGDGPLPVKWMAPESITDGNFSSQSDVWAFGIVLWELFSLGKTPYPGMEADERFLNKLLSGYRMERPKYAPNDLYGVMQHCWESEPKDRPTFSQLEEKLGNQLEASVRHHYIDLNAPFAQKNQALLGVQTDYLNMMGQPHYVNVGDQQDHNYVNCPSQIPGATSSKQSDYLAMSQLHEDSQIPADDAGYLFMTSPNQNKTSGALNGKQENNFNFDFAPKVRKGTDTADLVELSPMLSSSSPSQDKNNKTDERKDSGFYSPDGRSFSNPNYVQQPRFNFNEKSDLRSGIDETEDQSPSEQVPINSDKHHYVNQPGFIPV